MPKRLPEELKIKAMELYLVGDTTAEDIAIELKRIFDIKVAVSTVYTWIKTEKWKDTKLATRADAIAQVHESETQRYARLQTEHLEEFESLRHKAAHELTGLSFTRAFDAAKALDLGIQGERQVMEGMINLQFVQDVMSVLIEEIQSTEILDRVAFKLKTLVQKDAND